VHWRGRGGDRGDPLTLAVNASMCSKTNEIYTPYIHFQGFYVPRKRMWPRLGPRPHWESLQGAPKFLTVEEEARYPSLRTVPPLSAVGIDFWPFGHQTQLQFVHGYNAYDLVQWRRHLFVLGAAHFVHARHQKRQRVGSPTV